MFLNFWLKHLYLHLCLFFREPVFLSLIEYAYLCSLNIRNFLDASHHDENIRLILYLKNLDLKKYLIIEKKNESIICVLFNAIQAQNVLNILLCYYIVNISHVLTKYCFFFFVSWNKLLWMAFLLRKIMSKNSAWLQSHEFSHWGMNIKNVKNTLSKNRCQIYRNWKPHGCITLLLYAVQLLIQPRISAF